MFSGVPTKSLSISELFSDPFQFVVPSFQRPFCWTQKEARQLLDDLLVALGDHPEVPAEPDYFLGAMLLLDRSGLGFGGGPGGSRGAVRVFDIIDGQQRLVTLTILMAALRDLATDGGTSNPLHGFVAVNGGRRSVARPYYRLQLRGREQDFIERLVQQPGACRDKPGEEELSAGESAILEVRQHFLHGLSGLQPAERNRLADYLVRQCHVVLVLIGDIDRAHRMFCVLNDRGRPLVRTDIIKAEVLGNCTAGQTDAVLQRWKDTERRLGLEFDSFFSHVRTIEGRQRQPMIAAMRDLIRDAGGGAPFLDQTCAPLAEAYAAVSKAEHTGSEHSPAISRSLADLGLLRSQDWVPAALRVLTSYRDRPDDIRALLVELDRYTHLLHLLGLGAGKRARRFADVLHDISTAAVQNTNIPNFKLSREEFRNIAYNLRNLHTRIPQICKIALLRLNDLMAGSPQGLDPANFTVEHVLPQKPSRTSQWRAWFTDNEEREACTQSLGNLVLVTRAQNDRASNQEFARKREIYFHTPGIAVPAITRDIEAVREWRAEQIRAREQRLMVMLGALWGVER